MKDINIPLDKTELPEQITVYMFYITYDWQMRMYNR